MFFSGPGSFSCEICQQSYQRRHTLKRHMHTHSDIKPHKCNICERSFAEKNKLDAHIQLIHMGIRFNCAEGGCDKGYTTKANLQLHISSYHNGAFKHFCEICAKGFNNRYNLAARYNNNPCNYFLIVFFVQRKNVVSSK